MTGQTVSVFWFRRDLRLDDNAGLYHALKSGDAVLPVFIYDTEMLDELEDKHDRRVHFIHDALAHMREQLLKYSSTMHVLHGTPEACFKELADEYSITAVYTNRDYEPYATARDARIADMLAQRGIAFYAYKDQVIFDRSEVVKDNGEPYTVFTPYSRKWKARLQEFFLKPYPTLKYNKKFLQHAPKRMPTLEAIGFKPAPHGAGPAKLDEEIARHYADTRDVPGIHGTTRLSVHLRFGTVSIRKLVAQVQPLSDVLLNELIWREFYQMILWHFPQVVTESFKKDYDRIQWRNNYAEFDRWCAGQTGYPIVDAGMRELNETGFMHNRVRMITASFLTKHLLIDWRWGEAYFGQKLLDYDLAANNGGWQWAAGSGCDAAPYFRIFNPYLQTKKFDPDLAYIKQWVPELESIAYPAPIVEHEAARERCLKVYKAALQK